MYLVKFVLHFKSEKNKTEEISEKLSPFDTSQRMHQFIVKYLEEKHKLKKDKYVVLPNMEVVTGNRKWKMSYHDYPINATIRLDPNAFVNVFIYKIGNVPFKY